MQLLSLNELPLHPAGQTDWPWTIENQKLPDNLPVSNPWPKISIVTPSFNQGNYLEKTIRSVLLQGYPNLEYIIIDGGSTDQSVEVIRKYEPWIDYWVSEKDRGQSHAINKGLAKATGDLLGWLNSDDYYLPGALFKLALAYLEDPTVGAVYGLGHFANEKGEILHTPKALPVTKENLFAWVFDNSFMQPSCHFTRKAWLELGPIDETLNFAMDLDYWIRIANSFTFKRISDVLSVTLVHPHAKMTAMRSRAFAEVALICMRHGEEVYARLTLDQCQTEYEGVVKKTQNEIDALHNEIDALHNEIDVLHNSTSWKITAPLRHAKRLYAKLTKGPLARLTEGHSGIRGTECYQVKVLATPLKVRPRVVHVIGNLKTGGSSRLVVDLLEHLGHLYEQEVITQYNPDPPNYTGIPIHEFKGRQTQEIFVAYLRQFQPELIHIHYWGETDKHWYAKMIEAAHEFDCKVVENINTPVAPYVDTCISRYVYVSDYVSNTFGKPDAPNLTIHPGSNFSLFTRDGHPDIPDDCIGMVYRLDTDKLNERSIDVFIKVVKKRPQTKVIIVGGGHFLEPYKAKVKTHHVEDAFDFTGFVPYENLPAIYAQMSLFIAPVWKESFGQVSPFAMSMGIPVVGYNIGALSEILSDSSLLASPDDSDALAEIIISLLNDRQRRIQIGQQNRERAHELFSVESMIESYAKLYQELIGAK